MLDSRDGVKLVCYQTQDFASSPNSSILVSLDHMTFLLRAWIVALFKINWPQAFNLTARWTASGASKGGQL